MTEAEFLERIDSHIAETKGHMERGNALFERCLVLHDDTREFIRQLTRRQERVTQDLIAEIRSGREEVLASTAALRELVREIRAQRESIWSVHDKLEGLGPEPGSA